MAASTRKSENSDDTLHTLAARAATLAERFEPAWMPIDNADSQARIRELWTRWTSLFPEGGEAQLNARLELSGWPPAAARARLGSGRWRSAASIPEWTATWRQVRARWRGDGAKLHVTNDGRWKALWVAFADAAELAGEFTGVLRAEFRRLLAARLTVVAGPVLEFELTLFQEAASRAAEWTGEPARATEADFMAELRRTGGEVLERNYPVAVRLCCEQALFLARAWRELARRLDADRAGLAQRFASGRDLGEIVACRGGLSDPHRGARMAVELRFASGAHLIYKPRPLTLEAGYFSLLAWLEARGARPRQRAMQVWDRGDYGWMEWVDAAACHNRAAARRHFRRTGAHLALLQVLGGSDLHSENWIAAGEFPVPIDLEVLLRPGVAAGAGVMEESVLGVGLLPVWVGAGDRLANISALGDAAPRGSEHRAHLGGRALSPADFVDDIAHGFRQTHTLLRRHRPGLLRAGSPLSRLRDAKLRHVARPTEVYGRLLRAATQPRALRDGAAFSLELERVAKALPGMRAAEARMIPAEIAALAALDVPLFQARARSRALESGERTLRAFFLNSGWAACRRRLLALSREETARQVALIRAAFAVAALDATQLARPAPVRVRSVTPPRPPARPAALLAAAVAIGRSLANQAVPVGRGVTWVGPQLLPRAERFQLTTLNAGLYEGTAGVGLFLAALFRATGDTAWARLARRVFTPLVATLRDPVARRPLRRLSAGIGPGRAGIVYALTHAAAWLEHPAWLAPDLRLMELLQPAADDSADDVIDGAAGAVLGALRLAAATADPAARRLAATWAARLAPPAAPHHLAGFAHGAAGIAAALARLTADTPRAATSRGFASAAAAAVAHEQSLFVPDTGNWLDLRGLPDAATARRAGRFTLAWCHGAPGILLARLSGIQGLDTPAVRADIAVAIETLLRAPPAAIDQCCCGEAGLIEALEFAGTTLRRPELAVAARLRAAALLEKARRRRGYNAYGPVPLPAGPGFFQGLAGIGYTWLRLAQPGRFPCVLAFE